MNDIPTQARQYLQQFCGIPSRTVGAPGNRAATDYFAATVAALGWTVETPAFDCLAWSAEGARLAAGGQDFAVTPSPLSPGGRVSGPLRVIETMEALEAAGPGGAAGQVLLLRGEIAHEPPMPRNFPFYQLEDHQRIYRALDASGAPAVVTATARNPDMAGALYPCPMIEDGDFHLPSVYLGEEDGARLAAHAGQPSVLEVRAERRAGQGCNVVARRGGAGPAEVVVMAHIDAKPTTPGALDNAAGVTVLLLLAELLAAEPASGPRVELVAMNGEEYYSAPGEQLYLRQHPDGFPALRLAVNLDGLGYGEGHTAYSLYGCPAPLAETIHAAFAPFPGLAEGQPWFQGDHVMFVQQGVPTLALTSERAAEMMTTIVHSALDTPERVSVERLAEAAVALRALVTRIR